MSQPFFAAIFVALLVGLMVILANLFVLLRLMPQAGYANHWSYALERWKTHRPQRFAATAWAVSVVGPWVGPLIALTGPLGLVLGWMAMRRAATVEANPATHLAAKMALINGALFTVMAMTLAGIWLAT